MVRSLDAAQIFLLPLAVSRRFVTQSIPTRLQALDGTGIRWNSGLSLALFEKLVTVLDVFFNLCLHSFPPVSSLGLLVTSISTKMFSSGKALWQASNIPGTRNCFNISMIQGAVFTLNSFTSHSPSDCHMSWITGTHSLQILLVFIKKIT